MAESSIHRKTSKRYHRYKCNCIADECGKRDGSTCDGYEKSPTRDRCLYLNYDTGMCWIFGLEKNNEKD